MKKILLSILGVLAVILLIAAILPKDFKIEKEVIINKPKAEVFNYLKYTKNSHIWSPWEKKDPNITHEYKGEDATLGFVDSWSGNNEVGVGEQETTAIVADERIDFELRFIKPMKAVNKAYFITEAVSENETKVIWGMTGRTEFPFNIICHFMQGKVKQEFANGLNNLKEILEGEAKTDATVTETNTTVLEQEGSSDTATSASETVKQ